MAVEDEDIDFMLRQIDYDHDRGIVYPPTVTQTLKLRKEEWFEKIHSGKRIHIPDCEQRFGL